MLARKIKDKCLKCEKPILSSQNIINCNLCKKVLHLKCTELTKSQFHIYQNRKLIFNYIFCTNYYSLNVTNKSMITSIVCVVISVIYKFIKPVLK